MNRWTLLAALALILAAPVAAGKVVHENADDLPPGCDAIAGEVAFTVHGGRDHGAHFHGVAFSFDNRSFEVDPCTKVTVTFVNDDDIRHQFMIHDTWPAGFFIIEVDGPGEDAGTFITGAERQTLLVHCGLPQHQQKGMKGQVLVAGGEGDLPNIPGISGIPAEDAAVLQAEAREAPLAGAHAAVALTLGALLVVRVRRN